MDIKKIGENKIRCALSEQEIENMGFDIDEIIGNAETTQKFMRDVLEMVEEQGGISLENISPMVKAELLQDHSMAITFGGESDMSFRSLVDTVGQLMSQMAPEKLDEFRKMSKADKQSAIDDFLEKQQDTPEKSDIFKTKPEQEENSSEYFTESSPFSLEFSNLDDAIRICKVFTPRERIPQNSLYKYKEKYYLVLDFIHFSKEELRPLAFAAVEYDNTHFSEAVQVAFIKEHGKCIVENEAIETLMQL